MMKPTDMATCSEREADYDNTLVELERVAVRERAELIDLLVRVEKCLSTYLRVCTCDYPDGEPRLNRALTLQNDVERTIALLERV